MDADTAGQIAALRSEIAQLRSEMVQTQKDDMAGGEGLDCGQPLVPIGGGDSQGTFRIEGNKITHCHFYAAHNVWSLQDVALGDDPAGTWYLNVPHANLQGASVSTTAGQNDDDHTCIALFTLDSSGNVVMDCRGMPFVPIYA